MRHRLRTFHGARHRCGLLHIGRASLCGHRATTRWGCGRLRPRRSKEHPATRIDASRPRLARVLPVLQFQLKLLLLMRLGSRSGTSQHRVVLGRIVFRVGLIHRIAEPRALLVHGLPCRLTIRRRQFQQRIGPAPGPLHRLVVYLLLVLLRRRLMLLDLREDKRLFGSLRHQLPEGVLVALHGRGNQRRRRQSLFLLRVLLLGLRQVIAGMRPLQHRWTGASGKQGVDIVGHQANAGPLVPPRAPWPPLPNSLAQLVAVSPEARLLVAPTSPAAPALALPWA